MSKPDRIEHRGEWMQSYHGGTWHLAVFHETYYAVSGRVFSTYHTTACNGASLYSVWGKPTVKPERPADAKVCKRCAAIAAKVKS
jgi:hypothetical protein